MFSTLKIPFKFADQAARMHTQTHTHTHKVCFYYLLLITFSFFSVLCIKASTAVVALYEKELPGRLFLLLLFCRADGEGLMVLNFLYVFACGVTRVLFCKKMRCKAREKGESAPRLVS